MVVGRRLGYLSGAPRVSTRLDGEASGPRSHVLGVIRAFEALGWQVKPFIVGDRVPRRWAAPGSERALASGVTRQMFADLVRVLMSRVNAHRAWRELHGEVDWVYERFAVLQSLGGVFKRVGVPWILETNGPFFYEAKTERRSIALASLARHREISAYQSCDVLVCVSEALKEIIIAEAKIPSHKVLVVPNGVDTTFFDPGKHRPRRFFRELVVGFVGSLIGWQGLDLLFQSMAELRTEGVELASVVVGDGPMRGNWEGRVRELGLSDRVRLVGRVRGDEVPSYIAGFDLGYSGQVPLKMGKMYHSPLKLYEYMAMAKPVLASAFEDARRVVRDGHSGFLFEPGNGQELKKALLRAYQAREALPEMGRRAQAVVQTEHSWVARVREMIQGIERILEFGRA